MGSTGIRIEHEIAADQNYLANPVYVEKDISSLGIIAPFKISVRARAFASLSIDQRGYLGCYFQIGGSNDDLYHYGRIRAANANSLNLSYAGIDSTTRYSGGTSEFSSSLTLTQEVWFWWQLEVTVAKELYLRIAENTGTSIPTTWDLELLNSNGMNFTPDQILQSVGVFALNESNSSSVMRFIHEVDEIHLDQI